MIIHKMRCYFLYNIPLTEKLLSLDEAHEIGVTQEIINKFDEHFNVTPAHVPAFYTSHYRLEHTPHLISDPTISHNTYISKDKLGEIDFFQKLNLQQNARVHWEISLSLQTTGLITICVETSENIPSEQAYHLSGLHLNPDYKVIATEPLANLWQDRPRPEFVTLDELAQTIRTYFFQKAGIHVRRVQALRHEIQIPFTAIEVETPEATQEAFVKARAKELAELVFKPACWEVEHASVTHAHHILDESRVWTVAQDTYVAVAYEGALYVKIRNFDTGVAHEVSSFHLADELSVLHSFKLAVSNYHLLRIMDDLLDSEVTRLRQQVGQHQKLLRTAFEHPENANPAVLHEMNDFVIQVTNLQFDLVDLMEEIDNSDKLIDEEWHIVLLDKLHEALGTKMWRDSMNGRINNLRELVQTIENAYQRFLNLNASQNIAQFNAQLLEINRENQRADERMKVVSYFFAVLAVAEVIGLLIDVGIDDNNPLVQWLVARNASVQIAHVLAAGLVFLIIMGFFGLLVYLDRKD